MDPPAPGTAAPTAGLDRSKTLTDPPKGLDRLVIDAPAAIKRKHLFQLVGKADLIVVAVLPSAFDQGSRAAFLARLHQLKAIRKSRKPVGVLRNRVRARTRATARLARFLAEIEHADLGALADRAIYNDVAAQGLSLFDLSGRPAERLRADWARCSTMSIAQSDACARGDCAAGLIPHPSAQQTSTPTMAKQPGVSLRHDPDRASRYDFN